MYRVGIVGHSPEYITNSDFVKDKVESVLNIIRYQYGEDLVFNLAGDIGVGEWAADACIDNKYRYHLFLPYPVEEMEALWYPDQLHALESHFGSAWATTISFPQYKKGDLRERENYVNLIDYSAFIICFWNGMKQGPTADAIKYALSQSKLVINGLDDLRLITSDDMGNINGRSTT